MKRTILPAVLTLLGSAHAAVIDFSEFDGGDLVNEIISDGITITVNSVANAKKSKDNASNRAMIFDTFTLTGQDPDLVGPFTDVRGGADLSPGNVLILSEDGDTSDPDDNWRGGTFEFLFDVPVDFKSFVAFDMNDVGGIELELFGASGSLGSVTNLFAGADNSFELMEFMATDVTRAVFTLSGSGAIGNIVFNDNTLQTPVPAAGLLLGSVLVVAYGVRRRQSEAERQL